MIRVNRGSKSNAVGATQRQLTCLWTTLKNNNQVIDISHALAQLHAVDDNLQGTLKNHQDDRIGVPSAFCMHSGLAWPVAYNNMVK